MWLFQGTFPFVPNSVKMYDKNMFENFYVLKSTIGRYGEFELVIDLSVFFFLFNIFFKFTFLSLLRISAIRETIKYTAVFLRPWWWKKKRYGLNEVKPQNTDLP